MCKNKNTRLKLITMIDIFSKKLKLNKSHKSLLKALSKEMNVPFDDMGYNIMELGFIMLRLATENKEKISEAFEMFEKFPEMKKMAKLMREWWEAGKEIGCDDPNCDCKKEK